MTLDAPMLTAIGVLFTTLAGAVGWLFTKIWSDRDASQAKVYAMLEKQFDAATQRKDLFDSLGKTVDGLSQSVKDMGREMQSMRADLQRIRP